ncbi:MAG TPA: cellulase family glycosylhydrolase, partial [Chloroflexota bacterium]
HWGYLVKEGVAPVLLGEFGGRSVGDDREGQWQRRLVQYLRDNGIHYTYWSFNGNSGDTGGILADDWVSVNQDKQALLSTHQGKLLGNANPTFVDETVAPGPRPSWKPLRVLQQDRNEEEWTTALTPEVHLANKTGEPVGLGDVEVRYWFTPEGQVRPEDLLVKVVGAGFGIVEPKPVDPRQVRVEVGVEPYEIVPRQPLYFVKLTFAPDLQVPQHATLGVRLRVEARDGATLFQENDYSRRKYHWPTAWERIGLYRGGALVWGEDPQSFKERMEAKRASLEDRLSRRR